MTGLIAAIASVAAASSLTFSGSQVIRALPPSPQHAAFLERLQETSSFDFWDASKNGFDIRVDSSNQELLQTLLTATGIPYSVLIEDVQTLMNAERKGAGADWFSDYHNYNDTVAWINALPAQFPGLASTFVAGSSYEGRELRGVKISSGGSAKPSIYFDGGIHAREWWVPWTLAAPLWPLAAPSHLAS